MIETLPTRSTNETLRNDMWRACDILRRDNNVGGVMQYTEHLAWLLFLKFLDEEEKRRADLALLGDAPYEPVLTGQLAWDFWASPAALEQRTADTLIQFVRGRLLPALATLTGSPLAVTIAKIFSDESVDDQNVVRAVPVCASGYNLKEVLAIINRIRFDQESDMFTISLFYEDLLERMSSENRTSGEFHTPRAVIKFMVDVIAPQIGEAVYDPAVGSAGFLVQAFLFMQPFVKTVEQDRVLQERTFVGIEKKAISALLGMMNMVLHGIHSPVIMRANTLEESVKGDVGQRYDVVLTNPPFGGTEGGHIQQNFTVKANATELLFLQHIIKKLKKTTNARAAMVVPEGTLFRGGAFAEVKRDLFEQFHLFMVVSLPPGTFAPYSDVKTALLFFRRPDEVMQRQPLACNEVLYYELPLPTGLKKFSKGSRIADEHFTEVREVWRRWHAYLWGISERPFADARAVRTAWAAHQNGNDERPAPPYNVWIENTEDLAARNYDLSARNPNQNEAERLPAPAELTARLLERSRELHSMIESLHAKVNGGEAEA
ncbi:MAG TPA: class I SAM-dependent DNA methyltransferase [Herpetosiphonaceae bacterium]|nr:class I SAM-dependent DNA methyltransferase [Herpetosiphonaceae bacterium]